MSFNIAYSFFGHFVLILILSTGISRDRRHKRRPTGGRMSPLSKKRKYDLGRPPSHTRVRSPFLLISCQYRRLMIANPANILAILRTTSLLGHQRLNLPFKRAYILELKNLKMPYDRFHNPEVWGIFANLNIDYWIYVFCFFFALILEQSIYERLELCVLCRFI